VMTAHKVLRKNPNISRATGFTADGSAAWTANTCCRGGVPMAEADISSAYDTQAIDRHNGFKTWNVTSMVREWMAAPSTNFGLLLNADTQSLKDRYRTFASVESTPPTRPFLSVTYTTGDVTPPAVAISSPVAGARLAGIVGVTATATDNVAVAGVQFKLNGVSIGAEVTAFPYTLNVDSTAVSDGTYTLSAVARDTAGNTASSAGIAVTVANGLLVVPPSDTYLNLDLTNYSTDTMLATYTWPDFHVANAILMKFNLSTLPTSAVISDARLFVSQIASDSTGDATYAVAAHKLLGKNPTIAAATGSTYDGSTGWSASSCCYDGLPLAQADISPAYDTQVLDKTNGFKSWVLTPMVQEWVTTPSTNFGVLLNSDASKAGDRYRYFASTRYPDATARPQLRIKYSLGSPADTTRPTVSLTAPGAGAIVNGTIAVSANASDNVGVIGVQFKLDGANLGAERTTSPYSVTWDSSTASNATHTLTAVARDAAGNQTTATAVTVTVSNQAAVAAGIAANYSRDIGIETDPSVVFVEKFDESTLSALFARWNDTKNGAAMTFSSDVPANSASAQSLNIPWSSSSSGGHLYRVLTPGVDDVLYVRYYIKYPTSGSYQHEGVEMGGYNPPSAWPVGGAGTKPSGSDLFSASAEQSDDLSHFDHYDYFTNMRPDGGGSYWGNTLLNNPNVTATPGQWMCVEHMVKLNALGTQNGEHAIWINGTKVSHVGLGFPNGFWSGGNFTQNPSGTPFDGIQWRTTSALNLNWLWVEVYAPNGSSGSIKYANIVAAKSYIGCLAP
jgi:hypothetical protein